MSTLITSIHRYTSKNILESFSLKNTQSRKTLLNIYHPSTKFESRSNRKSEKQNALILQNSLKRISKICSSSTPLIFDLAVPLLPNDVIPINDIFNKLLKDFELKYKLLCKKEVVQLYSFDVFSMREFNKFNKTTSADLQKSLENYINTMARFGMSLSQSKVFVNYGTNYYNFAFDIFEFLHSKNLIYEKESAHLFSYSLKKDIHDHQSQSEGVRTKHFCFLFEIIRNDGFPVTQVPANSQIQVFVTFKEHINLICTRALWFHELVTYSIFEMGQKYYICEKELLKVDKFFKGKKITIIDDFTGAAFATSLFINPAYPEIEIPSIVTPQKDPGSGITGVCPSLYTHHLSLFLNNGLSLENVLNEHGMILDGVFKDENILFVEKKIQKVFEKFIFDSFFFLEMFEKFICKIDEKRLFYRFKRNLFMRVSSSIKEKTLDNFLKMSKSGPSKDIDSHDIEAYIIHGESDIQISSNEEFGIPLPVLKPIKYSQKFTCNEEIIAKFKNYFHHNTIFEFYETDLAQILDSEIKSRIYKKDVRVFDGDFLRSINFLFDFEAPTNLIEHKEQTTVETQDSVTRNQFIDGKIPIRLFEMVCQSVTDHKLIAKAMVLQELIIGKCVFTKLKTHAYIVDENNEKSFASAQLICDPSVSESQNKLIGHGSEAFRLFVASSDLPKFPQVNILLKSEFLLNKNAEINLIRKVFWESLRLIGNTKDDFNEPLSFESLRRLDKLILIQFRVFCSLIEKAYEEQNYNVVYSLLLDFVKFYVLDFYIGARKQFVINYHFSSEAKNIKQVLSIILEGILIIAAPILPLNCQDAYSSIEYRPIEKTIFAESWPDWRQMNWIQISEESSLQLECIKILKEQVALFFAEQKAILKNIKMDVKSLTDEFDQNQFEILIMFDRSENTNQYNNQLQAFQKIFYELKEDLRFIFECSKVELAEFKNLSWKKVLKSISVQLTFGDIKVPIRIHLRKITEFKKCDRCLIYLVENLSENEICDECFKFTHPNFAK